MRMTLNRLRMDNFKGCRHLDIDFSAGNTTITGMNGTGKTTIVDAFCWVLFNQNAAGDAPGSDNFREKPLDENGNTVHNLDTTVELMCTLDGQRFDLKRTQVENWVKKRGSAEATFQGNVSTYWINDVETKQIDFKARIKAIADDEVFRLVGSLSAFNQLEWRKRRQQLLNLAGSDVDDILLARDEYRPIADEIAQRNITPDDLRKVLSERRRNINKELQMLPVRIDEASKAMPNLKPSDIKDAEYIVADTRKDIEKLDQAILDARAQDGGTALRTQILAQEQECITIKRRIMDEHEAQRRKLQNEADAAGDAFRRASAQYADAARDAETCDSRLEAATKQVEALRADYMEVKRRPPEAVSESCPTCGQPLPQDRIDEIRKAAEQNRRAQLLAIQERGKQAAAEMNRLKAAAEQSAGTLDGLKAAQKAAEAAREAANAAVRDFPQFPDEAAERPLREAEGRLEALRAQRADSPDEKMRQLMERKQEMQAIIDRNMTVLNRRDLMMEAQQRVKAYEARQQELGAELSDTDVLIALAERFVQDRCSALEESINSHFPTVRWKLFDMQINGGMTDTCIAMLNCDGAYVPYESANTASQIAADVEIVDVLSNHYDIRVPLFIDNAERINTLPRIESQTIALSVGTDSELKIKEA